MCRLKIYDEGGEILFKLALDMLIRKWKTISISAAPIALSVFFILYELTTFHRVADKTSSIVKEMDGVDIWVVDRSLKSLENPTFIQNTPDGLSPYDQIRNISKISGVEEAGGFSIAKMKSESIDGRVFESMVIGLDENSFFGAPDRLRMGKVSNLRFDSGVIIDEASAHGLFSRFLRGQKVSAGLGATIHLCGADLTIVGIAPAAHLPTIYTTLSRAAKLKNFEGNEVSFILIKAASKASVAKLCAKIEKKTGLRAFSRADFSKFLLKNFLKDHSIPNNFSWVLVFGFVLALGILGAIISSTCDAAAIDLRILKTIGASRMHVYLVMSVAAVGVAIFGWTLGIVLYLLFYLLFAATGLIFAISSEAFFVSLAAVILTACIISFYKGSRIKELQNEVV